MVRASHLRLVQEGAAVDDAEAALDLVFAALSDPVRRRILDLLDGRDLLVSEIAANFDISLQAVSRHIQVLVRAGMIAQERTGRINRCRFDAEPIHAATLWLNRYSKYWQAQFDLLAAALEEIEHARGTSPAARKGRRARSRPSRSNEKKRKPRRED